MKQATTNLIRLMESQEKNPCIPIGDIQGTFVCREPVVAYIVVLYYTNHLINTETTK